MIGTNNPKLTGTVHVATDTDQLFDDLAHDLVSTAQQAIDQRGCFHLALSGGSTPKPFYHRLAVDTRYHSVPWAYTHLWIVDERRVAETDNRSNVKMIREILADHVPLPSDHLHPMPVLDADPAARYEQELTRIFDLARENDETIPRLDYVVLGLGDDGHTASLFPQSEALGVTDRWIVTNDGPAVTPPPRLTMTYPLLNAAHRLVILVTGLKKAAILRAIDQRVQEYGPDIESLPITGIQPHDGQLTWYLDNLVVTPAPKS